MWNRAGIRVSATTIEAINAKVLVNASGLKSLPSGPSIAKTGRKLTMVVATAVSTAPPTSRVASKMRWSVAFASLGSFVPFNFCRMYYLWRDMEPRVPPYNSSIL